MAILGLIVAACGFGFLMILNSWDKEKETKGKISDDGCSSQLAIILLVIFLVGFLIFSVMQCGHSIQDFGPRHT